MLNRLFYYASLDTQSETRQYQEVKSKIEKRRDPQIPVDWPVVLNTPQGAIKGKTANICVSGLALFVFLEKPEIGDEFEIILKAPEDHEMSLACEKIWSDIINLDESVYFGIGARFTKISSSDKNFIASIVDEYYLV